MNEDCGLSRFQNRGGAEKAAAVQYTAKDFQLEVLGRLPEVVIQDARNTARRDSEIEATKARVVRLEQIAATNTEGRIRTEVELGELRDGQAEIKALIRAHDDASMKVAVRK
jgi:soluble cytochrome b562